MIIGFKYNSIYYIGLLLAISGYFASAGSVMGHSGPKMEIDHQEFDFGIIPGDCKVEFRTWIRSTGSVDLEIADIKTGCACISSYADKEVLAPGDSAEVVFRWMVRDTAGTTAKQVFVFSNAGSGVAKIGMTAMIGGFGEAERVQVVPDRISSLPGRTLSREWTLKLNNKFGETCTINPVMTGKGITLAVPDSVLAGETGAIHLEVEQESVDQPLETSFTIEVGSGSGFSRRITVPVAIGNFGHKPTYVRTLGKN